jgi:DNA-directed RNA polymerase delta subunit
MKMKKLIKRWFGIDQIEENIKTLKEMEAKAVASAAEAQVAEQEAKMTPKERATERGESYVAVLDTKVNKDNPRNGFFELDWNDYFIADLKKNGYGFDGDPEEEIVDRWFRDIVRNMLGEEGLDPERPAGFINVTRINKNKSEVF